MKKKILITGAEGFLGTHLTNFYKKKNYQVFCTFKKKPKLIQKNVKYFNCDVRNNKRLNNILFNVKPDLIFHLAAKSHPLFSFRFPAKTILINTMGTINILQNVLELKLKEKQGVDFIFLSPLFLTKNYQNNLGVVKFNLISKESKKPIIALGGIRKNNLNKIKLINAVGFSGITFFNQ